MKLKLPRRFRNPLFALLMSSFTGLLVSGAISALHSTTPAAFFSLWMHAFLTAWPLVFFAILLIAPRVAQLVDSLLEPAADA